MKLERLRKISKTTLREEDDDAGHSFEWESSYQGVSLRIGELVASADFRFHATSSDPASNQNREVVPDSGNIKIKGIVDKEMLRDQLHFAENVANGELINPTRMRGDIRVELISYDPEEANEDENDEEDRDVDVRARRSVSYRGSAFRVDGADGEDGEDGAEEYVYFGLLMPSRWVSYIARTLEKDGRSIVDLQVHLASFEREVEAVLREHWHSRELVVLDGASAYAVHLNIETPLSDAVLETQELDIEHEQLEEEESSARADEIASEQRRISDLVRSATDPIRALSGAIVVLTIVLAADITMRVFGIGR